MKRTEQYRTRSVIDLTNAIGKALDGRSFVKRHWGGVGTFVVAVALAVTWAVYVFLWFVGNAQSTRLIPSTLGLWTMSNLASFLIYAVFWELLLVGVPVVVLAVVAWMWWKRLPAEERTGRRFGNRSRSTGGGPSLLFFIAFCVKVYLDGNWNVPIATFTLDYVVGSALTILIWGLFVLGVLAVTALAWWIGRAKKNDIEPR